MRLARTLTAMSDALRNGRLRDYLGILVVGSGARMFGLVSQFVVLLMLSRFLPKDSFGHLMVALGFYRLIGIALGVGGSLVLLFHVSRHPDDRHAEIKLQRFSALMTAIPAAAIALAAIFAAGPVTTALGKPSLGPWLQEMAPFLVFTTLLIVATGALEGRSRVTASIFWGEAAPNAVRLVLLPLVAVLNLPDAFVAHVMTLSVVLPWLWLARRMWDRSVRGWQRWSSWDWSYCGKFVASTLFANQLGAADLVVAGLLLPAATVADYAVASRLAALFTFFQLALLKRFAPRAGRLLAAQESAHDHAALVREFDVCRRLTIASTALTVGAVLLLAPLLLPLLGNYGGARVLMVLLAIPAIVQAFYATSDRLLIIAGQPNVALFVTALSFALLALTPFATVPWLGAAAIPAAMMLAAVLIGPIIIIRAWQLVHIRSIAWRDAAFMASGCVALASAALADTNANVVLACAVLGVIAAYYIVTVTSRAATDDYGDESSPSLPLFAPDKASR
jgi:O-antigen/teichoic acid export membrane protein